MSKWFNLLWLSFFTAVVGESVFFALMDPKQLYLFGEPVFWSSPMVYSVGFFMFWGLTALTAMISGFMLKPAAEVNAETPQPRYLGREKLAVADTEIGH